MNIFKTGLYILSPTSSLITELLTKTYKENLDEVDNQSLDQLKEIASKQEISDRLSESQAKVLQELAIARRIETADEVEIEEYFDTIGEGNIGVQTNDEKINVGAGGAGRKVVKRVYRFKGWSQEIAEEIEKEIVKFTEKKE